MLKAKTVPADFAPRIRTYTAEPTGVRFHADRKSFVRGIMGPIGSGKSVMCVQEIVNLAANQRPSRDGVRRTRWAIIRNTYPELLSTTIKTWVEWIPESVCPIVYGAPITGRFQRAMADGTYMDCEVLFLALDRPKDVKKMLSLEITGAWINEASELDRKIVDTTTSRVGRYPPKMDGGPTWSGVIMDTNPPDSDHWWYRFAEEECPKGWRFFRQPGALIELDGAYIPNAAAENVEHQPLGMEYWLRQASGKPVDWVRVMLMGEYGTVMDGKPIYAGDWNDARHVADVKILERHAVFVGWDWGLTPAAIIAQVSPHGRLCVMDEVIGDNIGVKQFAEGHVIPLLRSKYRDCSVTHIGDPAGRQRAQTDERSVFEVLASIGIHCQPAPSNSAVARWEAVRHFLAQLRDGVPAFALSPRCKMLRKGFNGGYRFRRMQVSGTARFADVADKNSYSHPHDALQYICLHLRGMAAKPTVTGLSPVAPAAWA